MTQPGWPEVFGAEVLVGDVPQIGGETRPLRRVNRGYGRQRTSTSAMPMPSRLPPTKPVGTNLSFEVLEALDAAVTERGLSKRALFEIALRRELDLPPYPGDTDGQEALPISA